MQLTPARLALWLVAAITIGGGAFLLGQSGSSHAESPSPGTADEPRQMTLPGLTAVAPLPKMKTPPHHKPKQGETEPSTEEATTVETPSEVESYETPVEEYAPSGEESSGSSGAESVTPPAAEPTEQPTEQEPTGGGEELRGET
jgi:hypothetical protein